MTHSPVSSQVIAAAIDGNPNAVTKIFHLTRDPLRAYVARKIPYGYARETDDVVSETYLRMIRNLPTYVDTGRDIMAWLYTIARNVIYDIAKSSRYRHEQLAGFATEDAERASSAESIAIDIIMHNALTRKLEKCMSDMTKKQQNVIVCRFVRDMSNRETSQTLGLDENQVKSLQHRALRTMARRFGHTHQPIAKGQRV